MKESDSMDTNYTDKKTSSQLSSENSLNIKDFLMKCLDNWYWFLISVAVCLVIGVLSVLRTQPVYERSSTILIKEQLNRRVSSNELDMMLGSSGMAGMSSRLVNEVIAFKSPALMTEVVNRLGLQTEYSIDGRFHSTVIYGDSVPVSVEFCGNPGDVSAEFLLTPRENGGFTVSKLSYFDKGTRKSVKVRTETDHAFGDTVDVVVAKMIVRPAAGFEGTWKKPLRVTRRSMYASTRKFSSMLTAQQLDEKNRSDVLVLRVSDSNIQRADEVLSMLLNVYNENWVTDKNKMAISTTMFINDRLQVIEKELGNVDESISEYKSKNLIPDVASVSSMYMTRSTETARKIQELDNQLYVTKFVRNYLTNNDGDCSQLIPMASSIQHTGISAQISEYNTMVLRRNNIVANSSESNPLAVNLAEALTSMRKAIVEAIDNQVETLDAQLQVLQKEDDKTTARIAASPSQAKYLLSVERQQKVKESLYLYLLQKREENELSQAFTAYNTRLITPPGGSSIPVAPKSSQMLLIALFIGFLIPLCLIYLLEVMNTKVRSRKDLEGLTLPFLGEVPQYVSPAEIKMRKSIFGRLKLIRKPESEGTVVVKEGKRDVINEAFRVLRTNIEFMSKSSSGSQVIIFTSYNPGSGKTFLCMNTAVALAIKGLKVLCIDGDFRHASLSQYIDSPENGFCDYLAGRAAELEPLIVKRAAGKKTLDVLPVGTIPPNPSELLAESKFEETIKTLSAKYDYVFIDCPPVDLVTDTQIIQQFAERTVFVVRARLFERAMLSELQKLYDEKKFKNMCYVLNGTDSGQKYFSTRYGNNYSAYRKHYGYYITEEE